MRYFPLFLDLDGRDVLVIGGGAVALRKVETLRLAGARVTVIAESLHEALRALAARGGISLHERRFESRDIEAPGLARPRLIIAATGDRDVNAVAARAADAAGIPCNVLAGYFHDHLLVPVDRRDDAVRALLALSAD